LPSESINESPFREELPRLLVDRQLTLRALARAVGGIDHGYLSRMVNGKSRVNPRQAKRIAVYLGLPPDYFPEVREAAVVEAIESDPRLRDAIYFDRIRKRSSRS
jgi:transcriptional regulator with XRE-family HTH domain